MYRLEHTARHYAWGSKTAFAHLFGMHQQDEPTAELWFGTHPASPSTVDDGRALTELVDLPYLLKIIAAEKPLSIQSHPNKEQAAAGFRTENEAGIPLDSPVRNYKDANHKPELLLALTNFSTLCGFRPADQSSTTWHKMMVLVPSFLKGPSHGAIELLAEVGAALAQHDYKAAVKAILTGDDAAVALVHALTAAAEANPEFVESDLAISTALSVAHHYPSDPGVLVTLLMQRVDLVPGQAIFLSSGIIHAYLHGIGVEVMACSDNVLRGGLTQKHIDVEELLAVSVFEHGMDPLLSPVTNPDGLTSFQPDTQEFRLDVIRDATTVPLDCEAEQLVLCISGTTKISSGNQQIVLAPGEAAYLPVSEHTPQLTQTSPTQSSPLTIRVASGLDQ